LALHAGQKSVSQSLDEKIAFEIFGDSLKLEIPGNFNVAYHEPLSAAAIRHFHSIINQSDWKPIVEELLRYKKEKQLNDWLYYQVVRKTAQQVAPKQDNYLRYTLYKWFLMVKSGYDATLNLYNDELLFYVYSNDEVFNLPLYEKEGRQYVCLNIHDYARAVGNKEPEIIHNIKFEEPLATKPFSYKVTRLPDFNTIGYTDRDIRFPYKNREYHFTLKVNQQVNQIFNNYPTVAFADYFNIPLSTPTYESLMPVLQKNLKGKSIKKGVDYLMKFTRYAFLYEDDYAHFGKEKRMPPEQTLLSSASDCDDRAALFFYLVKEVYNLPMLALVYPDHITIAVLFDRPYGKTIHYDGQDYSVCEPTPQRNNLQVGQLSPHLKDKPYQIVYAYHPGKK
jgi:hypothetical protein